MRPGYILDTNVFIQAKNDYYAFDIAPSFWEKLAKAFAAGIIKSPETVLLEITDNYKGEDELKSWVQEHREDIVLNLDDATQKYFAEIVNYVKNNGNYEPQHADKFLNSADPWVIACAKAYGATVVTQEKPGGPGKKKVKIPDVCTYFNVRYIDTFTMLRETNIKL